VSEPALIKARYRGRLEEAVGEQLHAAGIKAAYEGGWVPFAVPSRTARYLPDFRVGDIIIEAKGWWGRQGAKERQKFILLKEQHPELDIRFVFSNANKPIYKGSPTTFANWADDHGFKWSEKVVYTKWIEDLKKEMKRCKQLLRT
jgi:hypothetical protein